jgi:hypothetical protein
MPRLRGHPADRDRHCAVIRILRAEHRGGNACFLQHSTKEIEKPTSFPGGSQPRSPAMDDSDLLTLIAEARRLVTDDRYIWCCASEGFDSRCVQRRGLLLGGALSPHFLRDTPGMWSEIPWTVRLRHCRVVVCDKAAQEPLKAWLPLMEAIAGAGESLLVVT